MDIFKFINPTSPTKLEQGEIINGLRSKMWIERYSEGGEFTFVASASSGMRDILPIGTLISHVETEEVMRVENHEISDEQGKDADIKITGRGFETFFENRVVGSNVALPVTTGVTDYALAAAETWDQAVSLVRDHIYVANLIDDNNSLPYVEISNDILDVGVSVARSLKKGDLYARLLELLAVDALGIRVIRPGIWSPLGSSNPDTLILIHKGVDRSNTVIFSYDTGEIERADYLWSDRKKKNCALVAGRWVEVLVDSTAVNYDRRMMFVDASDVDNSYAAAPTGVNLTAVQNSMRQRGLQALANQNDIALTKAEVSKNFVSAVYRTDFNVGDIITIHGDYNEASTMRISEYVEIEDENGKSGYPTLTTP